MAAVRAEAPGDREALQAPRRQVLEGIGQVRALEAEAERDDQSYEVRLLPEYLFRLPEDMRPADQAHCGSLLAMQKSYLLAGTITSTNTTTYGSVTTSSTTTYYPFFSALDVVAVYDLADPASGAHLYRKLNAAQVEDDEWFESHKTSSETSQFSNRAGHFDEEALKAAYEEYVDEPGYLALAVYLNGMDLSEDAGEAD